VLAPSGATVPTEQDLQALAAGLPLPKHGVPRASAIYIALFVIIACLGLGFAASPSDRAGRMAPVRDALWVLALVLLMAWPILFSPFDTDAPAQRAAFAAVNAFGDWNHPFLPYLLNHPTTWFSLEPWALRLVPLIFLCAETLLTMWAATRDGGNLAGPLAAVWFACEIRRRHGLYDLSDWDIAGTFLVGLLLVLQRRRPLGWRDAFALTALMVCGVMSSWLMIVVAGVLVGCLGIEVMLGRMRVAPALAVAVVFGVLGMLAMSVFATGTGQAPLFTTAEILRQMLDETPLGRTLVMAVPVALGLGWLVMHLNRPGARFAALNLIAVPCAIYVAQLRSHVNGGYYVGLATPLLVYAAAVGTATVVERLAAHLSRLAAGPGLATWMRTVGRPYGSTILRGVLMLGLAVTTIRSLGTGEIGIGAEHLQILARKTRDDRLPIFTNSLSLVPLLTFERARAGEGPIADTVGPRGDTLGPGVHVANPTELQRRVRVLEAGACAPARESATDGFYLVYLDTGDREAKRACVERLGSQCRTLASIPPGTERSTWVLRCDPSGGTAAG
jgi:hypothetical protein